MITILKIISQAAADEGLDVRTSELHGLSQRGGSVEVFIRFGKKIYSPLVTQSKADLVISLEEQEALNGLYFSNPKTVFLVNKYRTPTFTKDVLEQDILEIVKKNSKNIFLIPASEICQKILSTDVVSGIYLLGYAVDKKYLPLKQSSIVSAIKKIIPKKYLELNLKALNLSNGGTKP